MTQACNSRRTQFSKFNGLVLRQSTLSMRLPHMLDLLLSKSKRARKSLDSGYKSHSTFRNHQKCTSKESRYLRSLSMPLHFLLFAHSKMTTFTWLTVLHRWRDHSGTWLARLEIHRAKVLLINLPWFLNSAWTTCPTSWCGMTLVSVLSMYGLTLNKQWSSSTRQDTKALKATRQCA